MPEREVRPRRSSVPDSAAMGHDQQRTVTPQRTMTPQTQTVSPVPRRRARLFSSGVDEPRARRATDLILLGAAVVALALLTLVAVPQAGYERALTTLARAVPGAFDSLWRLLIDLLGLAVLVVVVATVVRRRFALLRDLVVAAVAALAIALVVERAAVNAWPELSGSLRISGAWFAPLRLSIPAAVAMTASPHLSQPARRVDRWVVLMAALASVLLGASTPTGAVAGVVIGMMAAAAVHLTFGSCRGRPSLDDVAVALAGLGVAARSVGAADRQREGLFLVDATDAGGDPLVVKVFGRDANDTQLLTTLWRTVWYREAGSPTSVGRLQQVEHEAFLTLLAAQAGVPTARVVTAGATVEDDVLLVLKPWGRPLAATPERWSDDRGSRGVVRGRPAARRERVARPDRRPPSGDGTDRSPGAGPDAGSAGPGSAGPGSAGRRRWEPGRARGRPHRLPRRLGGSVRSAPPHRSGPGAGGHRAGPGRGAGPTRGARPPGSRSAGRDAPVRADDHPHPEPATSRARREARPRRAPGPCRGAGRHRRAPSSSRCAGCRGARSSRSSS